MLKSIKVLAIELDDQTILSLKNFSSKPADILNIKILNTNLQLSFDTIKLEKPEIIFLNPNKENLENLNLLETLEFSAPKVIFISNNRKKAYDAFKYGGLDFLLAPIQLNDIIISVYKYSKLIDMEFALQNEKVKEMESVNSLYRNSKYLSIASIDKIELVKINDIVYCKADGKYTEFLLNDGTKLLSSKNLGEYQSLFADEYFYRIHHSYIVNIQYIKKITKKDGMYCEFTNGIKLPIAKRRQDGFSKFINL